MNTDVSGTAVAGLLLQEKNSDLLPVSYFSKSLSPSQKQYPVLKLELMVIVNQSMLSSSSFTIDKW